MYIVGTGKDIINFRKIQSRITANNPATAGSLRVTLGDLTPTINPVTTKLTMKPINANLNR